MRVVVSEETHLQEYLDGFDIGTIETAEINEEQYQAAFLEVSRQHPQETSLQHRARSIARVLWQRQRQMPKAAPEGMTAATAVCRLATQMQTQHQETLAKTAHHATLLELALGKLRSEANERENEAMLREERAETERQTQIATLYEQQFQQYAEARGIFLLEARRFYDRMQYWGVRLAILLFLAILALTIGAFTARGQVDGVRIQDEGTTIKQWAGGIAIVDFTGAGVSCTWGGIKVTCAIAGGGAAHNILSATHSDSLAASVVLGDIIHGNATPAWARLAGNITTTKKFLSQTGTGAASAVPVWDTVSLTGDVSGILPTANGGTGIAFFTAAGPTVARVYTFPDAAATVLTTNAAVTIGQGGTGTGSTLTGLVRGSASAMTAAELSGAVTTSGSNATTLAAKYLTLNESFSIFDPVTGDTNRHQIYFPFAVTITKVTCSVAAATSVTIQFDERAEATPNTAGTDVMTSTLVCDVDSQSTTSFSNATIAAHVPMNLQITAVSGTPGTVRVHVEYTID